ncbi:MAG: Oligopeptide transport protein superfamily, ATP-binding protein, partial [Actinomycetota bacterium]
MSPAVPDRNEVEPLIETVELRTHFRTPRGIARAVDGVTLQIRRGQSLGVVGESGSGKTVLSRSIMGLLPRNGVIREGSVRYGGEEIGNRTPKQMRSIWG